MKAIRAFLTAAAATATLAIPPAAPAFAAASQAGCTELTVQTTTNGEVIKTGGDLLVVDNDVNPRLGDWVEVTVSSTDYWIININENVLPVTLQLSSTYSPPNPYGLRQGTPVTFPAGPVTFTTVCN